MKGNSMVSTEPAPGMPPVAPAHRDELRPHVPGPAPPKPPSPIDG